MPPSAWVRQMTPVGLPVHRAKLQTTGRNKRVGEGISKLGGCGLSFGLTMYQVQNARNRRRCSLRMRFPSVKRLKHWWIVRAATMRHPRDVHLIDLEVRSWCPKREKNYQIAGEWGEQTKDRAMFRRRAAGRGISK